MKLYGQNDMVRVGCHDCMGCSQCCRGMGDTVLLDAYDVYRLTGRLGCGFETLLESCVELHVEEGLLLPNLRMEEDSGCCVFLKEGRCVIHEDRPGLCRAFPLGRSYEDGKLGYFLLEDCPRENKTKVKVEKWIGIPQAEAYQDFLVSWHYLVKDIKACTARLCAEDSSQERLKECSLLFLRIFFLRGYHEEEQDFFTQYSARLKEFRRLL